MLPLLKLYYLCLNVLLVNPDNIQLSETILSWMPRVIYNLSRNAPCFLGEHAELQRQESADGHSFQQGDKVKCLLEVDILRQMQEGHGGWNPKMAEVLESTQLTSACEQ